MLNWQRRSRFQSLLHGRFLFCHLPFNRKRKSNDSSKCKYLNPVLFPSTAWSKLLKFKILRHHHIDVSLLIQPTKCYRHLVLIVYLSLSSERQDFSEFGHLSSHEAFFNFTSVQLGIQLLIACSTERIKAMHSILKNI